MKKILILSVSAGAGHMRAAEAIRVAALMQKDVEAVHWDVMDHVPTAFRKIYTDFYLTLVNKAPLVWSYLYQISNETPAKSPMQKLRRGIERLNTRPLRKAIDAFKPDYIICTHFLPAEILARMKRQQRIDAPVWVQVTDFDLHRLWVQPELDGFFAANDEVAFRMHGQGIAPEKIHVTGIPIMPAFAQEPDRNRCAEQAGVNPHLPTLLLMGGGAGLGSLDVIAQRLLSQFSNFQLIVLAGKNLEVLQRLQTLISKFPARLFPMGFTNTVERLMACADLVITKPGGLTTSECLAMGLPMIVNSPIPGQEERNADYLLEQGVALKAVDTPSLEYRVGYLLNHPEQLQQMRERARTLGKPCAAQDVVNHVLSTIK